MVKVHIQIQKKELFMRANGKMVLDMEMVY
jgi:hypothetical protein